MLAWAFSGKLEYDERLAQTDERSATTVEFCRTIVMPDSQFPFAAPVGAFFGHFSIYYQSVTAARRKAPDSVPLFGNANHTKNEGVTKGNFLQKFVAPGCTTVSRFHVDSQQ